MFNPKIKKIEKNNEINDYNFSETKKLSTIIIAKINSQLKSSFHDFEEIINSPSSEDEKLLSIVAQEFEETHNPIIKEFLARILTTKKARKYALNDLLAEFKKTKSSNLRWIIGNALESMIEKCDEDKILELIKNKKYGNARQMLVLSLSKFPNKEVIITLLELLDDSEVQGHAIEALKILKPKSAITALQPFKESKNPWHKKTAIKAIENIENSGVDY